VKDVNVAEFCNSDRTRAQRLRRWLMGNGDCVRQLVTRAQRPDVRAAAGRIVSALESAAEQTLRPRGAARRSRGSG
jgi:hypothetical protein